MDAERIKSRKPVAAVYDLVRTSREVGLLDTVIHTRVFCRSSQSQENNRSAVE